jgi:hypothetical protein
MAAVSETTTGLSNDLGGHCVLSSSGEGGCNADARPYEYFTCRLTPLPDELVILCPWVETWSLKELDDNRTEWRWTVRCTDRSAEGMAKFEVLAARMRERVSQPEYGAAARAAIDADAAAFALDESAD